MAVEARSLSGHIRKRQYQPSITSFFQKHTDTGSSESVQRPTVSPLSPPLPAETQASLLNVGMRVRKSVPEGYKTHKTLGTVGFPFPSTALVQQAARMERPILSSQGTRELQPFCGLHKIGGWAEQEGVYMPNSSAPAVLQNAAESDDGYANPGMTMSQSTLESSQESFMTSADQSASFTSTRKRTYEEETEEDMDAIFDAMDASDLEPGVGQIKGSSDRVSSRLIAKPRRTGRTGAYKSGSAIVINNDDNDFDEATFLQPLDGMDVS